MYPSFSRSNLILKTCPSTDQIPIMLGKQRKPIITNCLKERVILYRLQHKRVILLSLFVYYISSSSYVVF